MGNLLSPRPLSFRSRVHLILSIPNHWLGWTCLVWGGVAALGFVCGLVWSAHGLSTSIATSIFVVVYWMLVGVGLSVPPFGGRRARAEAASVLCDLFAVDPQAEDVERRVALEQAAYEICLFTGSSCPCSKHYPFAFSRDAGIEMGRMADVFVARTGAPGTYEWPSAYLSGDDRRGLEALADNALVAANGDAERAAASLGWAKTSVEPRGHGYYSTKLGRMAPAEKTQRASVRERMRQLLEDAQEA